jgi:ribosome biogenesis GTPase
MRRDGESIKNPDDVKSDATKVWPSLVRCQVWPFAFVVRKRCDFVKFFAFADFFFLMMPDKTIIGTVLRAAGGFYEVDAHGEASGETILCSLRGVLKKGKRHNTQPVVVGDEVKLRVLETSGANAKGELLREGEITEVLPRRSQLGRSRFGKTNQVTVANLDQVIIVMSLREPDLNLHRLDRFLVLAESNELGAVICLNKTDLLKKRELQKEIKSVREIYAPLGYEVLPASAEDDDGIEELRKVLEDKTSAFIGSSGVGKSSLACAIQPGLHLWIGDVMDIGKGRHTTTDVSLHPLNFGGYIVDTPGVKTVALLEVQDVILSQCFPEMRAREDECRFNNCIHDHEPGCAVRAAVESKTIAASRYESYLKMLADQKAQKPIYDRDR